jgi:outer membrane protein OmpA-like peptidoglycan-associated protein
MQRAIVIVSDGRNEKSFLSETTILTKVLKKGIRIYTVGFGDQIDDEYLRKLAHVTDGEYYYALTEKDFSRIFADIQQRMHQFYQLSFSPVAHGLTREVAEGGLMALVETFGDGQGEELFQVRPSEARQSLARPIRAPKTGDTRLVDIYFAPGKTDIVQQNEEEMERIAQLLADYPFAEIEIRGHTDNTGNARQNEGLSQARAEAVRRLLLGWGVEPHRVRALGFGASQPVADNQTEAGRAKNRRTELVVVAN